MESQKGHVMELVQPLVENAGNMQQRTCKVSVDLQI
jgi:hypothetical protein